MIITLDYSLSNLVTIDNYVQYCTIMAGGDHYMNDLITIDASTARNEFFRMLDKVYMGGKTFLIKKAGIPVAELTKPKVVTKADIMRFAGIWKGKKGTLIEKYAKKFRKESKLFNI